jgi:hypothetical protein
MVAADTAIPEEAGEPFVDWRAVIAGAVVASGISLTLLAFGAAIGLSVASSSPTWRQSSPWLWLLSGLYLVFVALAGFGFGGFVAGRMRSPSLAPDVPEAEFRDSMHGVCAWALTVLIAAIFALGGLAMGSRILAPSSGTAGAEASVAGETVVANELDNLFRTTRPRADDDIAYRRAEAARILLKSDTKEGVPPDDRDYLAALAAERTGTSREDATNRVDFIIAQSKDAIHKARVAAVLQAFLIAAASFLGAAVAAFAAVEGGRYRERGTVPIWTPPFRRRTTTP